MSILGSVLKVCGTIVEGTGKVICDCVEAVEQERREYKASEQYEIDKQWRDEKIGEIKDNWSSIVKNVKELAKGDDK